MKDPFAINTEDDDADPYATPEYVDILPTMEEQMQSFRDRFWTLTQEAQVFGFTVVVALGLDDPIAHESHFDYCTSGGYFACKGLIEEVREKL